MPSSPTSTSSGIHDRTSETGLGRNPSIVSSWTNGSRYSVLVKRLSA